MSMRVMAPQTLPFLPPPPQSRDSYNWATGPSTNHIDTFAPGVLAQVISDFHRTLPPPLTVDGKEVGTSPARAVTALANLLHANSNRFQASTDDWGKSYIAPIPNDYQDPEHDCWSRTPWSYDYVPGYGKVEPSVVRSHSGNQTVWLPSSKVETAAPLRKLPPPPFNIASAMNDIAATWASRGPASGLTNTMEVPSMGGVVPHVQGDYRRSWLSDQIRPETTTHWTIGANNRFGLNIYNPGNGYFNGRVDADSQDDLDGKIALPYTLAQDEEQEDQSPQGGDKLSNVEMSIAEVRTLVEGLMALMAQMTANATERKSVRFEEPITSTVPAASSLQTGRRSRPRGGRSSFRSTAPTVTSY